MKTLTNMFLLGALTFAGAGVTRAGTQPSSDELAVLQATAKAVARDNLASPYKVWYFKSEFTSASFIATAMIDPDRERPCGLSDEEARTLIGELATASGEPVKLEKSLVTSAGFGIAYRKIPRQRYISTSRVVFDAAGQSAWLSVELNGERGFIMRLDKINGQWSKTSRCGSWYMPSE